MGMLEKKCINTPFFMQSRPLLKKPETLINQTCIKTCINGKKRTQANPLETIHWVNPLKIKESRMMKEKALQEIAHAEAQIKFHDKKLNYHREKLKFQTEIEFKSIQTQYQTEYPGLLEKNRDIRGRIHHERNVLQKGENALENTFVRQVASLYPERPEMHS
jgi:hypothetical protein